MGSLNRIVEGEGDSECTLSVVRDYVVDSSGLANWKLLAQNLKLKPHQIFNIERKLAISSLINEIVYDILSIWKSSNGNNATLDILLAALDNAEMKDAADSLWCKFNTALNTRSSATVTPAQVLATSITSTSTNLTSCPSSMQSPITVADNQSTPSNNTMNADHGRVREWRLNVNRQKIPDLKEDLLDQIFSEMFKLIQFDEASNELDPLVDRPNAWGEQFMKLIRQNVDVLGCLDLLCNLSQVKNYSDHVRNILGNIDGVTLTPIY